MYSRTVAVLVAGIMALSSSSADADSEIVVATRYLQASGVSHSHLYLYRADGRLLRQLTNDNSGQDKDPIFAPNGETIVYTREKGQTKEVWSIEPRGTGLKRLAKAPGWYASAKDSPFFTNFEPETRGNKESKGEPPMPVDKSPPPGFRSPDGAYEVILKIDPNDPNDSSDSPGHGSHYLLKDLKTGKQTEFGKLPGFEGVFDLLHLVKESDKYFLWENGLHVALFGLHLNSTDGDRCYAFDFIKRRLVLLSDGWSAPFPLPGEPAFLAKTEIRYVPIPGSKKTANSSYIDRFDANFKSVRYGRRTAAINYGASMYRPGKKPEVITIRSSPR